MRSDCDPSRIRGRTVLLVDDVTTTGSTLVECERVLSENGAFRVYPFALAKALTDEDVDGDMVRAGREMRKSHQKMKYGFAFAGNQDNMI